MKRISFIMFSCFFVYNRIIGQNLVWEKSFQYPRVDKINSIIKTSNGYLAEGTRRFNYMIFNGSTYDELILIKINLNGDSLFTKPLNIFAGYTTPTNNLKKCNDGNIFNAVYIVDTVINHGFTMRLYKIKPDGSTIWFKDYDSTQKSFVQNVCITADGGALLLGTKDAVSPNLNTGFVMRVDSLGNELWRKTFQPSIATSILHAEILNHHPDQYLISGNAGQYIWAAWIDGNGNTLNSRFIYYDSSNTELGVAGVMQSPNGNLVAYSTNSANKKSSYLGIYDDSGAIKYFGKKEIGGIDVAYVNTASEILLYRWNSGGSIFRKCNANGAIIDTLLITSSHVTYKDVFCAAWSDNDTAVFGGFAVSGNPTFQQDFYFVKIAGVGNEYLTATKPLIAEKPVTLYPNPAKEWFKINSSVPGEVRLYTSSGQEVLAQSVQSGEAVSLVGLPQGLYLWRYVANGQVRSGKVVRE